MTYRELYQQAKHVLTQAGKENPAFDAFCLFSLVTGLDRTQFVIHGGEEVGEKQAARLHTLAKRRATGEPLQYLLGEWEFMGMPFSVGEGVLIPRDDTEILVEEGARLLRESGGGQALDLCSGSGAVAAGLALLCPEVQITSLELSDKALCYLRANAERNGNGRVTAMQGDVFKDASRFADASLDLLLSNPPYIPSEDIAGLAEEVQQEPRLALDGGEDGLQFYRAIAGQWLCKLKPGASAAVEVGIGQAQRVAELFAAKGLTELCIVPDLAGISRVVSGKIPK